MSDDSQQEWGKTLEGAQKSMNECIRVSSREIGKGVLAAKDGLSHSYSSAISLFDEGRVCVNHAVQQMHEAEDAAVSGIKGAVKWVAANPNIGYPAAGTGFLLLLPGTRRLLWRQTLGRLRNPETMLKNSADRVQTVHAHVNDHAAQLTKLQERMLAAEAEYKSGYSKLKATRQQLQRLASDVAKDEKTADAVIKELRALKAMDASLGLRAEAASHLAQLRTQQQLLNKSIYRIAKHDI